MPNISPQNWSDYHRFIKTKTKKLKKKKKNTNHWVIPISQVHTHYRAGLYIMSEDETRSDWLFEIQQNQAVWSDLRLFQFTV